MLRRVHNIRRDRACGGALARAGAVKHDLPYRAAAHDAGVHHAADRRQQMVKRDQMRLHKGAAAVFRADGASEELDGIAQGACKLQIRCGDFCDALCGDRGGVHKAAEGKVGQDRGLAAGVDALHIRSGICLRVAELLRRFQRLCKALPLRVHRRKDIVRGAVQNAEDLVDPIRGEALDERPQNGDAPADAALEQIVHAVFPRKRAQLVSVGGHKLLVARYDALSRHERTL